MYCLNRFKYGENRNDKSPFTMVLVRYHEIQNPQRKNILFDYEKLRELAGYDLFDIFQSAHK